MSWLSIITPAWIAGSLLVLLSAPLGCLVLWRQMAFFSDTLAHGALLGVALAVGLGLPADLGIVVISALVILIIHYLSDARLPSDATLAVVASTLLCLGLLTLTTLTQQQARVIGFLFGNLLDLSYADLPRLIALTALGLMGLALIWTKQVKLATSLELAIIQGIHADRQRLFFMALLSGFCAVALMAVGSLLISGLLILPALFARLLAHSPKMMVIIAIITGELCVSMGIWGSVWLDIPSGLSIVLLLAIVFFAGFVVTRSPLIPTMFQQKTK